MSPLILVGGGVLLLCLGMGIGYLFAHSLRKREASKANDIQNELDDYRQRVTEHFAETAEHFESIGQQYRSLYKHMASGADGLCDSTKSAALLGFAASDPEVTPSEETAAEVVSPEDIRDYAPADENAAAAAEPKQDANLSVDDGELVSATDEIVDATVQSELESETGASSDTLDSAISDEPIEATSGEKVVVEKIAEADTVTSERTVH